LKKKTIRIVYKYLIDYLNRPTKVAYLFSKVTLKCVIIVIKIIVEYTKYFNCENDLSINENQACLTGYISEYIYICIDIFNF
jgi:hypothetical protein